VRMSYGCLTDVRRVSYPTKPPPVPPTPPSPSSKPPKQGHDGQLRLFPASNPSLCRCSLAIRVVFGYSMHGVKKRHFSQKEFLPWEKSPSCRGGENFDKSSPPFRLKAFGFCKRLRVQRGASRVCYGKFVVHASACLITCSKLKFE